MLYDQIPLKWSQTRTSSRAFNKKYYIVSPGRSYHRNTVALNSTDLTQRSFLWHVEYFFSFHFDRDIWRANQVRNANVVAGTEVAGFFDHSEYEEAKKKGKDGIQRMILKHLENTTVTVVLIGTETASRPWVKYEIEQSIARKNGMLGVYIHHLKKNGETSIRGPKPNVPLNIDFPAYDWDKDLVRFRREIEAAGQRADAARSAAAARRW